MRQYSLNKLRFATVSFVLSAMTFGLIFPPDSLRRVSAEENKQTSVKPENVMPSGEQVNEQLGKMSVEFEENRGQQNDKVRYMTRGGGTTMFLTATEAVYVLRSPESRVEGRESKIDNLKNPQSAFRNPQSERAVALYMRLAGANENANFAPSEPLEHRTNYFIGSDRNGWVTEIPNYQRVTAENIYDGVDMVWQGKAENEVQYDFIVQPNVNPNQIEWEIEGAENVSLDAEGNLLIETEVGVMKQGKPFSYQDTDGLRAEIESSFVLSEPSALADGLTPRTFNVKFNVGNYDRSKPLTIDPSVNLSNLTFSTFLGGATLDEGRGIAVDAAGNVYVTGLTLSSSFPTVAGGFDTSHNGNSDVFVAKLNVAGSGLIYSTFIGGPTSEFGSGIAVDAAGNAYLTGGASSADYPTTAGAYDTTYNGGFDVFATKLNAAGSGLLYSTFIGGPTSEFGSEIAVDAAGNAYLTGDTDSAGYPTTAGAYDTTHNGNNDVFATKLNAAGSGVLYSTFIGGPTSEFGNGIEVDAAGNAYLTGYTDSAGYPTTAGAYDTTYNGGYDVFATKLNAAGSGLVYSTFIGGPTSEFGYGSAVDAAGNAYLTGDAFSADYPTTAGAYDTTHNGNKDVFATKLNAAGSGLVYSTFIGGTGDDFGYGIAVDAAGNAYLTGFTESASYPTTGGAYDMTYNGSQDVFATKLNGAGSALVYSTFIGGTTSEWGLGIAVDAVGNAYLTGWASSGYPTTTGAFDTTQNGGFDVFVTKLSGQKRVNDFDGDGRTDISIFRPSNGQWWYLRSSDDGNRAFQFGNSSDKIAPGDFTGDGKTDIANWRPSTGFWFVLRSEDSSYFAFPFGVSSDIPVPADYDGDRKADAAVFRPSTSTWFINKSTGGTDFITFGASGDQPVVADYDGDGKADIAIYRPSLGEWWVRRSSNQTVFALQFGASTDKAVPGDYTGDGKSDIAYWRPSDGTWFILRSEDFFFYTISFGSSGDIPAAGDYNGDGKFDVGVFRPSNSTWIVRSTAGTLIQQFGIAGDIPVPSAFVP
ncbi:MAG: SBBP repeat-containing protein [Pyrinomonadaceae bacterium]